MENIFKQVYCPSIIKITHSYPISVALSLDQEEGAILAHQAVACVNGVNLSNGVARVSGVAFFNILYKEEGNLLSYESSAELAFEINDSRIAVDSLVDIKLQTKNTAISKGASGLEITAEIYAEGYFNSLQELSFLADIEGAVVKRSEIAPLTSVKCFNTTAQIDGEKSYPFFIEKVIYHSECARVTNAISASGEVVVEGEITSELLLLKRNGERALERVVTPFRYEVDCEASQPDYLVNAFVSVNQATFKISSEEEKNSAEIVCEYSLFITGILTAQTPVNCVIDGFSTTNEMDLEVEKVRFANAISQRAAKHKHFGEGDITLGLTDSVIATAFCKVEDLEVKREQPTSAEVSGVATCFVIVKKENGELYGNRVQAPFFVTVDCNEEGLFVNAQIQGSVARNLEGKCLLEFELILTLNCTQTQEALVGINAIEGEEREQKNSAISVVFINKGDDLWAVCKKALASEQVILADNPDVTFPAKADKAVVVYRKLQ